MYIRHQAFWNELLGEWAPKEVSLEPRGVGYDFPGFPIIWWDTPPASANPYWLEDSPGGRYGLFTNVGKHQRSRGQGFTILSNAKCRVAQEVIDAE